MADRRMTHTTASCRPRAQFGWISRLAGLLALGLPLTALAQTDGESVAGWQMRCLDRQGCVAVRSLNVGDQGPARVMFAIGPRPENIRLNIIGPPGTAEADQVRVAAGNFLQTLTFETCVDQGCLAARTLRPDTLTNMTELPQMVLTITSGGADQPMDAAVPLDGLGPVVDAMRARL